MTQAPQAWQELASDAKRELLARLLREKASRAEVQPLSHGQSALWLLHEMEPASAAYNVAFTRTIRSALDVSALKGAIFGLTQRHEILRTTYGTRGGEPVQRIHRAVDLAIEEEDARSWSPEELKRRLGASYSRPFDLERGPVIRVTVFHRSDTEHVLLLTVHHIAYDGRSSSLLADDLLTLYAAGRENRSASLEPLPARYADFVRWQNELLAGPAGEEMWAYWRNQLRGPLPTIQLPTDKPRPPSQSIRGGTYPFRIDEGMAARLRELARQQGATLYMVLFSAFATLLHRYSGQDDILVGSPTAGRSRSEFEGLIGYFVNLVVLRADLSGNPTFAEHLARVRTVVIEALKHADFPFPLLVQRLNPGRDPSRTPLFQVIFNLMKLGRSGVDGAPAGDEVFAIPQQEGLFDLDVEVLDTGGVLIANLKYATDLFEPATIARMEGQLQVLLRGIVERPGAPVSELPLLTEAERHEVLEFWNQTAVVYPPARCAHELVEERARARPDALAVQCGASTLSYRELDERAGRLAERLREEGVRAGSLVAVYMERSVEMVVGLLAVWKAGAAYVPIDPEYPPGRVRVMLEDTGAPVVLTQKSLAGVMPVSAAAILCLDAEEGGIAARRGGRRARRSAMSPGALAYVIYTSGSTGQPKGVPITHASLHNLNCWHQQAYEVTPADRATQIAGPAFDASVWEIWPYLTAGASVHIPDEATRLDPGMLVRWLIDQRITLSFLPTPLAEAALRESWPKDGALRVLLTGGDRLSQRPAHKLPFRLVNHYGPTENTVVSTCAEVQVGATSKSAPPIGRPLPNTRAYVLDPHLQPVPIGVPGELLVGGVQLAAGYWNRPELSAEKFIADPFDTAPGARLYRTGDLVRYRPDGNIEFLGRIDNQVKLRGYRIELGEIEAALSQHPAIREVVVLAREDAPGDKRLVAYVVARQAAPTSAELKEYLSQQLPQYMVPSVFVTLDALPLTPNGKVDRNALPVPDRAAYAARGYEAPVGEIETTLAQIWAEVLKLERVGIQDNFFELGGDSILSFQVIAKARQAGLRLKPKHIFQYQKLAELAAVAEKIASPVAEQGLATGDVPLTPIQHWFFEQKFVDPHHWNQAVWLELRQEIDPSLLEQAFQHLIIHHDALRMRFRRLGTGWTQFNAGADETQWLTRVDLSAQNEAEMNSAVQRAAAEMQAQFNLEEGPLLRAAWFDFGRSQANRLLIVIHHLVVDGVSWRILLDDLQTICQQLRVGNAVRLPEKTTSFKRWAQRLAEYACSAPIEQQRDYWLTFSQDGTGWLPVDFPGGENTGVSAGTVSVALDVEETSALIQQVPHAYSTQINDVLLSALTMALGRWSGQSTVCIYLEGHGREELFEGVDLSRTVGWFTTLFPVRLDLRGGHGAGDILKSIKEQLRRIPQRGIGFGLSRYLSDNKKATARLRALPQPEFVFNYLGQFDQTLSADSVFTLVHGYTGPMHSLQAQRSNLLEINGLVANGRLQLDWIYSENVHRRTTIESLASNFMDALRGLIRHCTIKEYKIALLREESKTDDSQLETSKKRKIRLSDAIKMLGLH